MSLVARALEAAGVVTVIIGAARDIVEYCGVPRFQFTDFPLGNPCGRPWDEESQRDIVERACDLVERARAPRATQITPQVWSASSEWKADYMRVDENNVATLRAVGSIRREKQRVAKNIPGRP